MLTFSENKDMDKIETVRFEKILFFYCALKDLQARLDIGGTAFASAPGFEKTLILTIAKLLARMIISDDQSSVSKICFGALVREAKRRPDFVADILREAYEQTGSSPAVIKAFFVGDLLNDLKSV